MENLAQFAHTSLQVPNHSTQFSLHHTPLSALDSDFPLMSIRIILLSKHYTECSVDAHSFHISNHTSINLQHTLWSKHYTQCSVLNTLLTYTLEASTYNTQLVKSIYIHVWWAICPDPIDDSTVNWHLDWFVIWDNVRFRFIPYFLPPYSPSLNPIEGFFSSWR